jgi:hypothetical protein
VVATANLGMANGSWQEAGHSVVSSHVHVQQAAFTSGQGS